MTAASSASAEGRPPDPQRSASFSKDDVLEMLSNRRRRYVVHALKQAEEPLSVSELAERVASWEYDKPVEALTRKERKRVRSALRQFHLAKMAEYGFIEYDDATGRVELSDRAASQNFYVDSLTGGDVPWGLYYVGLSAASAVLMALALVGVPGAPWLTPAAIGACVVAALVVSSIGHFYDNYYRMRLGARDEPAEVGENPADGRDG